MHSTLNRTPDLAVVWNAITCKFTNRFSKNHSHSPNSPLSCSVARFPDIRSKLLRARRKMSKSTNLKIYLFILHKFEIIAEFNFSLNENISQLPDTKKRSVYISTNQTSRTNYLVCSKLLTVIKWAPGRGLIQPYSVYFFPKPLTFLPTISLSCQCA